VAGSSGKCILQPTIKVLGTWGFVSGIVTDDATPEANPLAGATVTAQTFDNTLEDKADKLTVYSSTTANPDGSYAMYLPPGTTYCIVAYKPNSGLEEGSPEANAYGPMCETVTPDINSHDIIDFVLSGSPAGNVLVPVVPADNDVNLSARNESTCGPAICDVIQVWGATIPATSTPYTVTMGLPELAADMYDVVVFTDSDTQSEDANPTAYTETVIGPFEFTP
jgi:hypothetical protein